jgi:flagellin
MGLRIRTNVASLKAQRSLAESSMKQADSVGKLSSGYRINKAADDAAGLAISESLRGQVRSMEQAKRNANDGISLVQVAEGSMNEISNILIRLREIATQAASDTIGNQERSFANKEYVQLVDEIDRIASSTKFNGVSLLGGPKGNDGIQELTFHVGAGDGRIANTDTIQFSLKNIELPSAKESFGLNKQAEIGPTTADDKFTRQTAADKLTIIDTALKKVAGNRSDLGALQNRLNSTVTNLAIGVENAQSSQSRIRDVDFADETAQLTQQNIMVQSGVSVLSQANSTPEVALALLR